VDFGDWFSENQISAELLSKKIKKTSPDTVLRRVLESLPDD